MNKFEITGIYVRGKRIEYDYVITGEWKKYFDESVRFWVEYDQDISGIPLGLASIPLISNVIVLASMFHAKIITPVVDQAFYEAVPEFMKGFEDMYPKIDFRYQGVIESTKIEKFDNEEKESNTLLYFSGGVDAYNSLIRHEKENLILLTVCGADTWYSNQKGFDEIMRKNTEIATLHNLRLVSCISTLRKFINEKEIYSYINPLINDNFWHGVQHGIGMFGLAAGYVYLRGVSRIYFASTYSAKDEKKLSCGSDPTIDDFVRIGHARIFHDGYEMSRQDKVAQICEYSKREGKKIKLRVCYRSAEGKNCCECEKCIRTIFGILVEGCDPAEFGFDDYNAKEFNHRFIRNLIGVSASTHNASLYKEAVEKFKKHTRYEELSDEMKVIYQADFRELLAFCSVLANANKEKIEEQPVTTSVENEYSRYLRMNYPEGYQVMCRKAMSKYEVRSAQESEEWIGNHGFMLDPSDGVEVSGNEIRISMPQSKDMFLLNGWAADFVEGQPLADLFVQIGREYYPMVYGLENLNLAKRFHNPRLSNICFRASIPANVLKKVKNKTISFVMVGFKDGLCYRYPELKYKILIQK